MLAIEIARQRPNLVRKALCLGLESGASIVGPSAQQTLTTPSRRVVDTSVALSSVVSEVRDVTRAQIESPTKAILKAIRQLLD